MDQLILEVADEYMPIGTVYQRLLTRTGGRVFSFACVFFRVRQLIEKGLLECKQEWLPMGGCYIVCRRNRRC